MPKAFLCFVLAASFLCSHEAFSQMDRGTIRKNNKRLMTYRGHKSNFSSEKRYISIGFTLNALNYYGDLAPKPGPFSTDISFTRPAIGLSFSQRLGPRYSLTAGFLYGTLRGSDFSSADENDLQNGKFRYYRNLSFRNRIKELSLVATFDLFENQATYLSRVDWTPYAFAGLAVFHHSPQALAPATGLNNQPLLEAGEWVRLHDLGTEGQYADLQPTDANYGIKPYKLIQLSIPFGAGVRFKVHDVLDLSAELGFRYLFTDYIDDVSQNYVDLGVLDSELARALSYRSNELTKPDIARRPIETRNGVTYDLINGYGYEHPTNVRGRESNKDIIMVTSLRLSYIIGKTMHKAKFR
ncbi:MAG TPA: DUF6089 family protein [Chryseosolibacter sp.]